MANSHTLSICERILITIYRIIINVSKKNISLAVGVLHGTALVLVIQTSRTIHQEFLLAFIPQFPYYENQQAYQGCKKENGVCQTLERYKIRILPEVHFLPQDSEMSTVAIKTNHKITHKNKRPPTLILDYKYFSLLRMQEGPSFIVNKPFPAITLMERRKSHIFVGAEKHFKSYRHGLGEKVISKQDHLMLETT